MNKEVTSTEIDDLIEELGFILDGGMALIHTRDIAIRAAQALQSLQTDLSKARGELDEAVKILTHAKEYLADRDIGYQTYARARNFLSKHKGEGK